MKRYIKPTLKNINLKFLNKVYFKSSNTDVEWLLTKEFFAAVAITETGKFQ